MKKLIISALILLLALVPLAGSAMRYGQKLCKMPDITCIKIRDGQNWLKLWPNPYERDVVKRLNRMNTSLEEGMIIAVPHNLANLSANDIAPFAKQIDHLDMKTIMVSPSILAWAAYDPSGQLVKWGPISGGKDYCEDIDRPCRSRTGVFTIFEKRGADCFSTKFPVDEGAGMKAEYVKDVFHPSI